MATLDERSSALLNRSMTVGSFKGEPYKCWPKVKEMRMKVYQDYGSAHDRGALRVAGGAWSFMPVAAGLGADTCWLSSEPYAASTAHEHELSKPNMDAAAAKGYASDMCGYCRNYLGSIIRDEYTFGGPFPRPDVLFQDHICCTHAKWYQGIWELEGSDPEMPFFCIDVSTGVHQVKPGNRWTKKHKIDYVANQLLDAIDELDKIAQKKWGRKFDDELFIDAVHNDCDATSMWAQICCLNQAVPAPMDEKSMFAFFNLSGINRMKANVTAFYRELEDEVKDRIARGVAAVPNEKFRLMGDSPPPWGHLDIFRYMEQYGLTSVGSYYNFGIFGVWEEDENGNRIPRKTPRQLGMELKTREDACRLMADWYAAKQMWQHEFDPTVKTDVLLKYLKQWNCDGLMMHYNRGCEMSTLSAPEAVLAVKKAGYPVMTYEGNMGDPSDFDKPKVKASIDAFVENFKKM